MARFHFKSLVMSCMVILLAGCGAQAPAPHAKRVAKAGTATLPPTPDLSPPIVPDKHPDGAYSVRGILVADKKGLPPSLQVRGYVAGLVTCPMTEMACKPAPHLYLSDDAGGLGRRLLVGGERDLDARGFKVGQNITLQGAFGTSSSDGIYFAPGGLVLLDPLLPPARPDAAP
ncbi:MAG: hypothetical protein EXR77_14255 [Myxococcales bacterium]|nr:hypothetical protein [Myxococcales bacterium]